MQKKRFKTYLAALLCISFMCPYFMTILQQGVRVLMVHAEEIPTEGECTANELNVRSGPGTDYAQVQSGGKNVVLTKGQKVTILSINGDWYEIETSFGGKNVKGYCLGTYIKVTKTAEPTPTPVLVKTTVYSLKLPAVIAANELNFRGAPDTDSEVYATLKNGDSVTVLGMEEKNGYLWYYASAKVDGKTKKGYLVSDYVTFTFKKSFYVKTLAKQGLLAEAAGEEKVTTAAGSALSVAKGKLLYVISEKRAGGEKWLYVRVTISNVKYYGYIRLADVELVGLATTAYVTPTPTPTVTPTPTEAAPTGSVEPTSSVEPVDDEQEFSYDATVTANELNLRKQASTTSDILATLTKNQKLTVLNADAEEDGIWYRVAAAVGKKTLVGYLFSPYVKLDFSQAVYAKVTGGALKLRSKASAKAVYVTKENGSILSVANKKNVKLLSETTVSQKKWFEVEVEVSGETYTGYATADRLALAAKPTPSPTPTPSPSPTPTATPSPSPSPTPTETPSPTPTGTPTPEPTETPTPTPDGQQEPTGTEDVTPVVTPQPSVSPVLPTSGQAKITGVTALALKELPQYGSKLIKNASGFSVVVGAENIFEVLDVVEDAENRWCHVVYKQDGTEYVGYINADYVFFLEGGDIFGEDPTLPTPTPVENPEDFEALLALQNFPESYKDALRALHAAHPTWKFLAEHTGLDWNTAVDNESVVGRNLISNTKGAEWKSFEQNAYNWKTDTFVVYDGSTWVTASREANAYYMDPRNFLDDTNIFQFELLTYEPSYQTVEGVESILKNTAMEQKVVNYTDENGNAASMTYGEIFVRAAEYSGVSPFHLASRVKQEVVVGTNSLSNSVSGTVSGFEGLYNYYNIGAYHSTVAGGAIANGLKYAKNGSTNAALNESMLIPWTDPYRAILGGAYYIGYSYINRGQNTIYLQKFNMTPTSTYSHQYMANIEAPYSEGRKVAGAYTEFDDLPLVFSIPVYLNMPEEPCGEPQTAYNPNNWLKSLSVKDAAGNELVLTPTFDISADQEYYIVVENSCDLIEVSAEAVSRLATVSGNTWYPLVDGNNEIVIYVTAENGEVREYRITVARET